jgi:site-specific DNA recombinase
VIELAAAYSCSYALEDKIIDAQNRHEALQMELHKIKSLESQTLDLSEEIIRKIVTNKKHLIHSADDADKKEVLQEFVDQVVVQPSNHLDDFQAEITYRVFRYGGELTLLKTLSLLPQ